ncbi:DUF2628 domain-containing protein [Alkalihalobacterium bogoriense]|uniref:DUF2628 domain-containing protein n=1 Tax=Alkalihalobacterium bogoriense TaxID=246272 RepID=UPI00047EE6FA|nr:DUF2628 domain-containing protein [Alkalihalobacterium bogoriense]
MTKIENSNEKLKESFVGEKYEWYATKWQKDLSWNWAAFFLSVCWLGYRKMYKVMFLLFAFFVSFDIIMRIVWPYYPPVIDNLIGGMVALFFGIKGNSLYKKKVEQTVEHSQSIPEQSREATVIKAGGTSTAGVFLALGLVVLYMIFVIVLYWNITV